MSLIVLGAIAAATSLVGTFAGHALWRRRRARRAGLAAPPTAASAAAPSPDPQLPIARGDVVQVDSETRWLTSAVRVTQDQELYCLLLLGREQGRTLAALVFAPPRRDILWLALEALALPPAAPSCIERSDCLLDRHALLPAELSVEGDCPIALGATGQLALYRGAAGEAALLLLTGDRCHAFVGERLAEGDYDNLGAGSPNPPAPAAAADD